MKYQIIPQSVDYAALPEILKKEADNQYERLKGKLSPDDFSVFDNRAEFKFVIALSDFVANTIFSYPKECAQLVRDGALDDGNFGKSPDEAVCAFLDPKLSDFELKRRLRLLRRTRYMVIAWRDLTGVSPIDETFTALSIPLLISIGLAPATTFFIPSL